jgi:hypothetical protein
MNTATRAAPSSSRTDFGTDVAIFVTNTRFTTDAET